MIQQNDLCPQSPESDAECLSSLVGSLIQVGSELFSKGYEQDAMAMFDSANSLLKSTSENRTCSVAIKHLRVGTQVLLNDCTHDEPDEPAADLYQEDECDVGPRVLRVAIRPVHVSEPVFLETCLLFNKALIYHENQQLRESRQLYQEVLQSLNCLLNLRQETVLSQQLYEMGARAHNNMGCLCYLVGEEELSKAHFEASLLCIRQVIDVTREHRLEYATVLSNCCRVVWMMDIMTESLYNSLKDVLAIRSSELPWDHVDVAASHYNIAVAEYARHMSIKAVAHLLHYLAVASHRAQSNMNDLDKIPALIYLLLIENEDKDDHLSQELTRGLRALQDRRQEQGAESPEVASILNFIGTILFHKNDHEKALTFFQEELRLEEIICKDSTDEIAVSVTCNNIGRIQQEMEKMNEAIYYYHRALKPEYGDISRVCKGVATSKLPRKNLTETHPLSANLYSTVWYNLGLIHDKLGSNADAIYAFQMSLELRKAMLGKDHPDIACLLYNIGVLQMEQHELKDASSSFREALRIRRLGSADQLVDQHVVKTLEKLSTLHRAKGNIDGALEASREVLRIQQTSSDYDSVSRLRETGVTLRCIAELHQATGELEAATQICIQSVVQLEQVTSTDQTCPCLHSPSKIVNIEQFVSSLLLLGSLYHETCEPLQANSVLQRASATMEHVMTISSMYSSLSSLKEVTRMLGTPHGAPSA
jgi:tetratricopeptide (TPR) repeat protein